MDAPGKFGPSCEQVEAVVLDLDRRGAADSLDRAAAAAHLNHCSRCAALQESWHAAQAELRALANETREARAPARVEMRLMQEFTMRHRKTRVRRGAFVLGWALAGAALVVAGIGWWNAQRVRPMTPQPNASSSANLVADASIEDSSDFTPLPGAMAGDTEDAAILRVRLQRGSLGALGLPVNEQRAGDWIQVDLLVGTDGLPEAVRLAQEEN